MDAAHMGQGKRKLDINDPGHMTNDRPYMFITSSKRWNEAVLHGRTAKSTDISSMKHLRDLLGRKAYEVGHGCHITSLIRGHDTDLFYGKVQFGNVGFSIGKSENCMFFQFFFFL